MENAIRAHALDQPLHRRRIGQITLNKIEGAGLGQAAKCFSTGDVGFYNVVQTTGQRQVAQVVQTATPTAGAICLNTVQSQQVLS